MRILQDCWSFCCVRLSDIFVDPFRRSFLDDLERIATRTYEPSDDDIVRARLRTVGVQEYRIHFGDNTEGGGHFMDSAYLYSVPSRGPFPFDQVLRVILCMNG